VSSFVNKEREMFEHALIDAKTSGQKRYTVLLSLALQVSTLAMLIVAPLIYTQVLPKAQLRSTFAAPTPPLPAAPKAPVTVRTSLSRTPFQATSLLPITLRPRTALPEMAAPQVADGSPAGDPYGTGDSTSIAVIKPPDPPVAPAANPLAKPVHIASMEASQLIWKVQPDYPQLARASRIEGVVEFTATIGKTGSIEHLQVVRGHPLLVKAAEDAILRWKYKPTLLDGEPVEVITDIVVNFKLTR
jgi:protein TonB